MQDVTLVKLEEKDGFFYFNDQQIISTDYPFTDYGKYKHAWGFLKNGKVYDTFRSIHQCCTGLIVHKRSDGVTLVTTLPIVATEARLVGENIHFTGAACNGRGTLAYLSNNQTYEWIDKQS